VEYTDYPVIRKRLAEVLATMRRRPWENYNLDKDLLINSRSI